MKIIGALTEKQSDELKDYNGKKVIVDYSYNGTKIRREGALESCTSNSIVIRTGNKSILSILYSNNPDINLLENPE